jgi:myo-inositol catabolism protein IolC
VPEPRPSLAFVETSVFTRRVVALGLEEPLRELQLLLWQNPEAGDTDPGTGGLRKVRVGDPRRGKGKRGGARVHYLWLPDVSVIYLMFVYPKDEASLLSAKQKRELRAMVEAIKREWADRRK